MNDFPPPLRPDETLLWEGSPVPGLHQRGQAIFLMIFGLAVPDHRRRALLLRRSGNFPRAATVSDAGLALFVTAFGLPFGGIGAFLVFGPIIEARTAHRDVRYALTTRAAYVIRQGRFPSLKVYPILPSTALELEPGKRACHRLAARPAGT